MIIDLHTHTNASDANVSRRQLLDFCALRDVKRVAITDHDTLKNSFQAQSDPVEVVVGCELSAYDTMIDEKVHILCYMPKDTKPLEQYFKYIFKERTRVGNTILEKVNRIFPVVTHDSVKKYTAESGVIYKQNIMSVLIEYGYTTDLFGALYTELFHKRTGSCYVNMMYGLAGDVFDIARAARGVVILAHPSVYRNMPLVTELAKSGKVDGFEVDHPRNRTADKAALVQVCSDFGLLVTGGSDYHGANGGNCVMPGAGKTETHMFDRLLEISNEK